MHEGVRLKASIIITSFNRSHLLSFGLETLARQGFSKDDVEILVLNDGNPHDSTEGVCELFKDELNIRYFTSTKKTQKWRIPGFAINHGVRKSTGDFLFISCAEIYHLGNTVELMLKELGTGKKLLTIPVSGGDDDGRFLAKIERGEIPLENEYKSLEPLYNIHLPFFIGMRKDEFVNIGGYDEDFTGVGFDDNDIMDRLLKTGNTYKRVDCRIVHLYHPRLSLRDPEIKEMYNRNHLLYNRRRNGSPTRNQTKAWGYSF
jgi:GT2 family glycosyltransferase